jgi:hypothetical protein
LLCRSVNAPQRGDEHACREARLQAGAQGGKGVHDCLLTVERIAPLSAILKRKLRAPSREMRQFL